MAQIPLTPEQKKRVARVVASVMLAISVGGATGGLNTLLNREEGNRTTAYRDMGGVWTICRGVTRNVRPGETKTEAQCLDLNTREGQRFLAGVDASFVHKQPDAIRVAFASLAYNIGMRAFLHSTALRLVNMGQIVKGCNAIAAWIYVKGRVVAWQVERRGIERELCLQGLTP